MSRAVRAGLDFVAALDRGSLGGLARLCATDAVWWVDSGPDRRGGDPVLSPEGSGRFPLHGLMGMDAKLALMRELGPGAFPTGCRQIPRRVVAGARDCVIEVEGHGVHASGEVYANRYAFVFDVDEAGAITSVREYLDTIHAQHVVGDGSAIPRTTTEHPPAPALPEDLPAAARSVLGLWVALAEGDLERFAAPFAPDATWWTDSGRDRRRGRLYARGDIAANGPFHGVVPIADKLAAMRARVGSGAYASPAIAVTPRRVIADDELVAVEATGEALLGDGARYQNRYLWVADVGPDGIRQLREYCDTLHVAELMGYDAEVAR
ncbi:nuclear transport factor 2 family protein [Nocardioides nitrophenolicus]|uniref:nuclear transport factor 2 family protein n=1 Tax=Nocardioides nitrophenolicus TaxID=60489 RepID=UPI00195CF498|nr:nuclear transport factor 2 family protein [Nocardioides nitrophenolicus]MBM7517500.1 ketosteroid isomerase-like protein [Nocardioides nitrophenolicus]